MGLVKRLKDESPSIILLEKKEAEELDYTFTLEEELEFASFIEEIIQLYE